MGPCSRPGEDPNAWKQFGPEPDRAIEPRYRPPGQRGILGGGLGWGGFGWAALLAHAEESRKGLGSVTLKINNQHTLDRELNTQHTLKKDYGWGVRVRRPFGARGRSSVRYGTRLGDLKENWFLLFSN